MRQEAGVCALVAVAEAKSAASLSPKSLGKNDRIAMLGDALGIGARPARRVHGAAEAPILRTKFAMPEMYGADGQTAVSHRPAPVNASIVRVHALPAGQAGFGGSLETLLSTMLNVLPMPNEFRRTRLMSGISTRSTAESRSIES